MKSIQPYKFRIQFIIFVELPTFYYKEKYAAIYICLHSINSTVGTRILKGSSKLPPYLYELIPPLQLTHRYPGSSQTFRCRTKLFRNSLLPFTITDSDIEKIDSQAMFRKKLLNFIRPLGNVTYGIYDPRGVRLLN